MPNISELEHLESEGASVADWVSLARRALEGPANRASHMQSNLQCGSNRLSNHFDRLRILLHIKERDRARTEYDHLDSDLSEGALRSACETS